MQLHVSLAPGQRDLQQSLHHALREFILGGEIEGGTRLPSSRDLAQQLGISRTTVTLAYERLVGEDLVESRERSGMFVRHLDGLPARRASAVKPARRDTAPIVIRVDGSNCTRPIDWTRPLAVGMPALDEFPYSLWSNLTARVFRQRGSELLPHGDPLGFRPLREAIGEYVSVARGVRCAPDEILICAGSQASFYLCALAICRNHSEIWTEDPGYGGAHRAFQAAGAKVVPIPIDKEGIDVDAGRRRAPQARLAIVTPSSQFPTGVVMSVARRLELLNWAESNAAYILEDDFDGEFRRGGRPIASLHGLQRAAGYGSRVIYAASFSRTIFPSLRLSYLVLPPELVELFVSVRAAIQRDPPTIDQAILAEFIGNGHFARHIRRMRRLYHERAEALLGAISASSMAKRIEAVSVQSGIQAYASLRAGENLGHWRRSAERVGSNPGFLQCAHLPDGVLMGFAHMRPDRIAASISALSVALNA